MISKERKKEIKGKHKQQMANTLATAFVVSDAITEELFEKRLQKRFHAIGLSPVFVISEYDRRIYSFNQPDNMENFVSFYLGKMDKGFIEDIRDFEILMKSPVDSLLHQPFACITAEVNLSAVNDLLFMAALRALGPLSKGVLINPDTEIVMDDWVSWSLDYMGKTMADVTRACDNDCPDFKEVLKQNPDLVYKKSWWKFW